MAEIEWPLEKDAGISSWHLIVPYHPEGYGSSRGELTQSVELLRALPRPWRASGQVLLRRGLRMPRRQCPLHSLWEAMLAQWRRWSVLARWQ
jgi:hypothetical protein